MSATASFSQAPTEFCFPLRDTTDSSANNTSSPSRVAFHSRTFTGIEIPIPIKKSDISTSPENFNDISFNSPIIQSPSSATLLDQPPQSLKPSKPQNSPHRKHAHRRSATISYDFKQNPGLVLGSLNPPTTPTSNSMPSDPSTPSTVNSAVSSPASPASVKFVEPVKGSSLQKPNNKPLNNSPSFTITSSSSSLPLRSAPSLTTASSSEEMSSISNSSRHSSKQNMRVQFAESPKYIPTGSDFTDDAGDIQDFKQNNTANNNLLHNQAASDSNSSIPQQHNLPNVIVSSPPTSLDSPVVHQKLTSSTSHSNIKKQKRHKKVKSWAGSLAGSLLRLGKKSHENETVPLPSNVSGNAPTSKHLSINNHTSQAIVSTPAQSPTFSPLSLPTPPDVSDLDISPHPDSPICHDDNYATFQSSSYIETSLISSPDSLSTSSSMSAISLRHNNLNNSLNVNHFASAQKDLAAPEPLIDLDAALDPFKSSGLGSSFQLSKNDFDRKSFDSMGFQHRRTESAPESAFSDFGLGNSLYPRRPLMNKRGCSSIGSDNNNDDVILEEEETETVDNPTTTGNLGQQHQAATHSSISLASTNSTGHSFVSNSNRDRDRARVARNMNSLSLAQGSLGSLALANNHSAHSLTFQHENSSPSTHTVASSRRSESSDECMMDEEEDQHEVEEEASVIPRITFDPTSIQIKNLHRLSSTTNDTITPSVSNHVRTNSAATNSNHNLFDSPSTVRHSTISVEEDEEEEEEVRLKRHEEEDEQLGSDFYQEEADFIDAYDTTVRDEVLTPNLLPSNNETEDNQTFSSESQDKEFVLKSLSSNIEHGSSNISPKQVGNNNNNKIFLQPRQTPNEGNNNNFRRFSASNASNNENYGNYHKKHYNRSTGRLSISSFTSLAVTPSLRSTDTSKSSFRRSRVWNWVKGRKS